MVLKRKRGDGVASQSSTPGVRLPLVPLFDPERGFHFWAMEAFGVSIATMLCIFKCTVCRYTSERVVPSLCGCVLMCNGCKDHSRSDDFSTDQVFTCRHCSVSYAVDPMAPTTVILSPRDATYIRGMLLTLSRELPVSCRFCAKQFENLPALEVHLKCTCSKMPHVCPMPGCGCILNGGNTRGHECAVSRAMLHTSFLEWVDVKRADALPTAPHRLYNARYCDVETSTSDLRPLPPKDKVYDVDADVDALGVAWKHHISDVPSFVHAILTTVSSCVTWVPDRCWWSPAPDLNPTIVAPICDICCAVRPLLSSVYRCTSVDHVLCHPCSLRCPTCPICRAGPTSENVSREQEQTKMDGLSMVCPCGVAVDYNAVPLHVCEDGGVALCAFCKWHGPTKDYALHYDTAHKCAIWAAFTSDKIIQASRECSFPIDEVQLRASLKQNDES
jgi:hypothetical protein